MPSINTAVNHMLELANDDTHGYAQDNRYGTDYDCSSSIAESLIVGGFKVSKYSTTRDLPKQLKAIGFIEVKDKPKRGDIYCTRGKHVVMCVDEKTIVHASINEKGTTTKGKPGDQTGKEICTRSFYTPSYGWEYHLRYKETKWCNIDTQLEQISIGAIGKYVELLQTLLTFRGFDVGKFGVDGEFGSDTDEAVKMFQKKNGLLVDGIVGKNTWETLLEV